MASTDSEMDALTDKLLQTEQECDLLRLQLEELRLSQYVSDTRRAEGFIVEFDYPYSPSVRSWDRIPGGNLYRRLIADGDERYRAQLTRLLDYEPAFRKIPRDEPGDESIPYWNNGWFPPLDALCLTALLVELNPRRYVEVGSGNSTKFARRAIADHGLRTRITSIDPNPRAVIDQLCDEVIRAGLETCDLQFFADLGAEDLLFIDNSHRSFQNSDVTVFFTEILPILRSGCHYGIHDIFLPFDYLESWTDRFYNEQYLLMAYLLGGAGGDRIVLPVHHIERTPELAGLLNPIFAHPDMNGAYPVGGAFWMVKA